MSKNHARIDGMVTRDDVEVMISIHSGLQGVSAPRYTFSFIADSENEAEMLRQQIEESICEHNEYVAANPFAYLESPEISKLKKRLNEEWDGRNHCWK